MHEPSLGRDDLTMLQEILVADYVRRVFVVVVVVVVVVVLSLRTNINYGAPRC